MDPFSELEKLRVSLAQAEKVQSELDHRVFHLKTLYDISRDIFSSVDSSKILRDFLLMTMGNFGVMEGFILTTETESREIRLFVPVGLHDIDVPSLQHSARDFLMKPGEAPWAVRSESVCIRPDFLPREIACAVPFTVGHGCAGLLGLGGKVVGEPYNKDDQEVLLTLTNNLAVALQNAGSFEEIRRLNQDLQGQNIQLAEAYEELKNAQAMIIEKEKVEHELQMAREIQQGILPRVFPSSSNFDLGARMVPAKAVGGDFFDFIPLGNDSLGIAVGDVSDKGLHSAIFMAMTRSLVRVEAKRTIEPRGVLEGVNEHLMEMNEAGMFVTVLYGVLQAGTRLFGYARAGHPPPILCRGHGQITIPSLNLGHPLGILPRPELDERTMELPPGSTMLVFTDRMTEATDKSGNLFGMERLREELRRHCGIPAQALCDRLVETVIGYQGDEALHDDVTLVTVRTLA